ncbi:MAG: GTPase Era [Eubacterium sp.]|nr:GTPase Era [Eubacterium sp.]
MSDIKKKSGFVAILGRPNVGKSTIMNHLIGMKIAAVSSRAQTTRKRIQTVYTDDRGQIVFLDTPGINKAETKLGEYMLDAAVDTLKTSDMILWVVEPSTFIGKGERYIAELIGKAVKSLRKKNSDSENVICPVMLVINKIDSCQDDSLIEKTLETYGSYVRDTEGFEFNHVCKVSATAGTGLDDMMSDIYDFLPEGPMYFDEEAITDETERDIAAEFIREKCLRNLDKEIPHGIAVIVDKMRERADGSLVDIEATIICERESHKGIIIGKNGAMLKRIGTQARHDIEDMLQQRVNLKLWVKVRPGWRDKKMYMDEYGFK